MTQQQPTNDASEVRVYPLPDDLYDSKDWRQGDYASRVEWLHCMYESQKESYEWLFTYAAEHRADLMAENKMLREQLNSTWKAKIGRFFNKPLFRKYLHRFLLFPVNLAIYGFLIAAELSRFWLGNEGYNEMVLWVCLGAFMIVTSFMDCVREWRKHGWTWKSDKVL